MDTHAPQTSQADAPTMQHLEQDDGYAVALETGYGAEVEIALSNELTTLENTVEHLAHKAKAAADDSERRGDRIDAMLAEIDTVIARMSA